VTGSKRVVIVGGGISGLTAAYDLKRAGIECVVFEKRPRLGGVIETRHWEDCTFDNGPDSFISQKPEALALIKELGLGEDVIGSNDALRTTYILKKGRLIALPDGMMMMVPSKIMPVLRSPLLSWAAKIRMGAELLRRPGPSTDRSVADFVRDHFGQEALDYLAEPLLSGVYGGDPARMSVASVLPRFLEMEARRGSLVRAVLSAKRPPAGGPLFRTLKGGLSEMVEALSRGIDVRHEEVQTIETGFRVRAGGGWIEAGHVILAGPAWSAGALLGEIDPELARLLKEIPYSSSLTLTLVYRESEFDGMRAGFGFLAPKRERQRLGAATFVSTKFPFRAPADRILLRCFFGGVNDEAMLQESDEAILGIARGELKRILGVTARPLHQAISRWPQAMAQYTLGHIERSAEIKRRSAAIRGLHLAGNAYEGIGIPDCIRIARAAAKAIISESGI
jgi:oxygen-dependent protoporphyrinogen oxidase